MTQTAAVYTVVGVTTVQKGTGEGESTWMVVTKVVSTTTTGTMTGGNVAGAQKEIWAQVDSTGEIAAEIAL